VEKKEKKYKKVRNWTKVWKFSVKIVRKLGKKPNKNGKFQ